MSFKITLTNATSFDEAAEAAYKVKLAALLGVEPGTISISVKAVSRRNLADAARRRRLQSGSEVAAAT